MTSPQPENNKPDPRICEQSFQSDPTNNAVLDDNSPSIIYFGDWKLVTGSSTGNLTQHETNASNASLYAPFTGTSIIVVGTVVNGSDPIVANYTIDGMPPQTRSVPTSSQCQIPFEPFFSATQLNDGMHHINITIVQVGDRPYFMNFFALDPPKRKSSGRDLTGGIVGGICIVIIFCVAAIAFRRRRSIRLKKKGSDYGDEKSAEADIVSVCTTCRHHRVAYENLNGQYDQQTTSSSTEILKMTPESPMQEVRSPASRTSSVNSTARALMTTRATQGSREIASAPALPPLAFLTTLTRSANAVDAKTQRNSGDEGARDAGDDGNGGGSRWSRTASSASKTLVVD